MIKLNDDLLRELGLDGLPVEEKKRMLAHIYETLEMRVGMKLAQQMTDEQLDEFEQFIKNNDEAGALQWLEAKFPHYKDVVSAEFEGLKLEIRQVAPQILASSASQMQAPVAPLPQAFPGPQHPAQVVPGPWPQAPPMQHQPAMQPQQAWPPQPQQPFPQQPFQPQPNNGFNVGYGAPAPQAQPVGMPGPQSPPQPYPTAVPSAAAWPPQQPGQQGDDNQDNQQPRPPLPAAA